ncbi:MAG: 5-aminolevulinate synthase [Pseudomonadota bacterium]
MDYEQTFENAIQAIKDEGRYREFLAIERQCGHFPKAKYSHNGIDKEITIWCSNDYLGMGQNPVVLNAMKEAIDHYGAGAGGTRNISGTQKLHNDLENSIADLHQKDSALLFSSGYVANEAALSTIINLLDNPVVFSDENNHASMIQGIRKSKYEKKIFQHNDVKHLEELLQETEINRPKLIAFESVYSMEGTIAPIEKICALAKKYNALTYLDEVHGVGLYGKRGAGVSEECGALHQIDIVEGTFGKAYGLMGGYIAACESIVDAVRSYASGFIFTTAQPPALLAGALASVNYLKTSEIERMRARQNTRYLKSKLEENGLPFLKGDSHIVPLMVGDAKCCKAITDIMLDHHDIYVQPINYPTVPKGSERMRLTATAVHTKEDIDHLVIILSALYQKHNIPLQMAG